MSPRLRVGQIGRLGRYLADRQHLTPDADAEPPQELFGNCPNRDAQRRLARAGSFQHGPHVVKAVLLSTGEVSMSRARNGEDGLLPLELVGIVAILNPDSDRCARRPLSLDTTQEHNLVVLDPLPAAASVTTLPPPEVVVDALHVQFQTCRHPLQDSEELRSVRFTGRQEAQHLFASRARRHASRITSIFGSSPVHIRNDSAPWKINISRPSITTAPCRSASRRNGVERPYTRSITTTPGRSIAPSGKGD